MQGPLDPYNMLIERKKKKRHQNNNDKFRKFVVVDVVQEKEKNLGQNNVLR